MERSLLTRKRLLRFVALLLSGTIAAYAWHLRATEIPNIAFVGEYVLGKPGDHYLMRLSLSDDMSYTYEKENHLDGATFQLLQETGLWSTSRRLRGSTWINLEPVERMYDGRTERRSWSETHLLVFRDEFQPWGLGFSSDGADLIKTK